MLNHKLTLLLTEAESWFHGLKLRKGKEGATGQVPWGADSEVEIARVKFTGTCIHQHCQQVKEVLNSGKSWSLKKFSANPTGSSESSMVFRAILH